MMSDTNAFSSNKDDAEKRLHDVTWTAPGFDSAPLPSTSQGFIMLTPINQPAKDLSSLHQSINRPRFYHVNINQSTGQCFRLCHM